MKKLFIIFCVALLSCNQRKLSTNFVLYNAVPMTTGQPFVPVADGLKQKLSVSLKDSLSYHLATVLQGKKFKITFNDDFATMKDLSSLKELVLSRDKGDLSPSSSTSARLFFNQTIAGEDTLKFYLSEFVPDTSSVLDMTVEIYRPDISMYTKLAWGTIHCNLGRTQAN